MKTETKFNKLSAWLLGIAILIMLLMSITAYAQESTVVTVGDFTIVAADGETTLSAGKDYTYENGELVISTTLPVTVSMREGVTSTTDVMKILTTGGAADITFDNLTINTADDYYAVQLNEYGATSENNPCTIRLVGTNTLENTYTYGHAIRVYGDNTDVNITSTDNGVLNISNTGSNGAVYSEHASDLTINGNAVVSVTAQAQSALNNCGTTTIAENAKVTLLAAKDGIISGNQSDDNVIIKDNADINITVGTGSGIRANNIASISDNAKIIIKGDDSGTSGIRAEKDIKISGYADITMNNTGAYGIRSYGGAVWISENVKISIDTAKNTGIYATTNASLSGNAEVTIKNIESYGINGSGAGFSLSDNVKFKATNVGTGIYGGGSEGTNISIGDSVQITVDGESDGGIKYNGSAGAVFSISGKPTINVTASGYGGGISFGKSTATMSLDAGSPTVNINLTDGGGYGLQNASDGTLDIEGNTDIIISGNGNRAIYADVTVSGNAKINSTATVVRGVYGDITIDEYAKVIINKATERGVYGDATVKGNSEFVINDAGEEGVYGYLIIQDGAKAEIIATGSDKVLSKNPVVNPSAGKTYIVKAGTSKDTAEKIGAYTTNATISYKTTWRYFSAELEAVTELKPTVSITANDVTVENLSESSVLIVASYAGDKLIDVKTIRVTADCTKTLSETELNTTDADSIKAFLWSNMTNIKPLCLSDETSL